MDLPKSFPTSGVFLAVLAFVGLLVFGVDPILSLAVLILWIGSLFLLTSRPPDAAPSTDADPFTRDGMRDLMEHSATPLLVTDKGKVTIANRAARKLLGAHVIGQDTRVAFRQPAAVKLLSKKRGGSTIVRGLARRRDIWRMNRQLVTDDLSVIELINQTAEADISRAHTDFVANASHELRTPLASIIGYVETLRESGDDLPEKKRTQFLDTILRESKRLQNLVSDLMSLSRVEAEKHEEPSTKLALASLIERAARDAAGTDRVDRLVLSLDDRIKVMGDEKQFEQLVRNLVDNALKYGAAETPVTVTLDNARDNQARLTVSDEGEGISPEHLPHLTRRFYRTDPGRSRASGGTGLGLAIVKHIVERHRGRLDIASELGKGTTVTVRIPQISEGAAGLS